MAWLDKLVDQEIYFANYLEAIMLSTPFGWTVLQQRFVCCLRMSAYRNFQFKP